VRAVDLNKGRGSSNNTVSFRAACNPVVWAIATDYERSES
jgi:hypothetical protein